VGVVVGVVVGVGAMEKKCSKRGGRKTVCRCEWRERRRASWKSVIWWLGLVGILSPRYYILLLLLLAFREALGGEWTGSCGDGGDDGVWWGEIRRKESKEEQKRKPKKRKKRKNNNKNVLVGGVCTLVIVTYPFFILFKV
jgi:hypothetical protein